LTYPGANYERNQSASSVTRFVFIGRLISLKGVDILLTAFNQLTKQTSASLTIVGDRDQKLSPGKAGRTVKYYSGTEPNQIGKVFFLRGGFLRQE
jgi:glycosyltransferase involved in cell wall biosynthesis